MSSVHTGDDDVESVNEDMGGSPSTQSDCHLPSLDVLRLLFPAVSASDALATLRVFRLVFTSS